MANISGAAGSIHRGLLEQRPQQLTVTGSPSGTVWLTWGRLELGRGVTGQPIEVDLTALPPGPAQITARWPGGSDTKTTTVVPDPKPGSTNTGHRTPEAGLELYRGPATIRGELAGQLITTPIVVDGGQLDDCLIRPAAACGLAVRAMGGADLTDCTIDGTAGAQIGLGYAGWTGRRLDIFGCSDGVRASTNAHLVDSWVHHLRRIGTLHPDCVQTTGGTDALIEHCTLDAYNPVTGDRNNAAVMIGGETAPLVNFTVRDCWVDGGNYSINLRSDAGPSVTLTNIKYGPNATHGELIHGTAVPVASGIRADGSTATARRHGRAR